MFTLRNTAVRTAPRSLCTRCLKLSSRPLATRALKNPQRPNILLRSSFPRPLLSRAYAGKTSADEIMETLQDQYATARDEFEMATEETKKISLHAQGDREAAREELEALKDMYEDALETDDAEEIQRRIGQRIRELENAVEALERRAALLE